MSQHISKVASVRGALLPDLAFHGIPKPRIASLLRLIGGAFLALVAWTGNIGRAAQIFPDLSEGPLVLALRAEYQPKKILDYRGAREAMFTDVDNLGGKVVLCYTGQEFAVQGIPDDREVNTEHTWPQSRFEKAQGAARMKSDLQHLFPTESSVNSRRGNNSFGDIPDTETRYWYRGAIYQTAIPPSATRDEFSEATNSVFEPREAHKGNVARALFYFYAVYGGQRIEHDWFRHQLPTLLRWHQQDPVDAEEIARTKRVEKIQGTANPFVLDETLAKRAFTESETDGIKLFVAKSAADVSVVGKVRLVQWNAHEVFSVAAADARESDYRSFAEDIRPDIVTINEFTSVEELRRIARHMQMGKYHMAASDFVQNDEGKHDAFEVGVISRYPITSIMEFDPTPDNKNAQGDAPETAMTVPSGISGLDPQNPGARGFLRVQIEELKIVIYVCHLKSSNGLKGTADFENAKKRERVAAAIVRQIGADQSKFPGHSFIVAGDMNVGETDKAKNGRNLAIDGAGAQGSDGYDDTHAIFSQGLGIGPALRSLTQNLGRETFDSDRYPGTGPIDCIYALGPIAASMSSATRAESTYNSDHFAVWVEWVAPSVVGGGSSQLHITGGLNAMAAASVEPNGIPAVEGAELRIGAWNIEHLGTRKPSQSPSELASYIISSEVALLALAEIHDNDQRDTSSPGRAPWENDVLGLTLQEIEERTGDRWDYVLTAPGPDNERQQLTGVAWNSSKAKLVKRQAVPVAGGRVDAATIWTRRPEIFHFSFGTGKTDIAVVPLHMKSNTDGDVLGARVRRMELAQLKAGLAKLPDPFKGEKDVVLLGDTNMKKGETSLRDELDSEFTDLNASEQYTYIKPFGGQPLPPFDRIVVSKGRGAFSNSKQVVHGPFGQSEAEKAKWRQTHLKLRSDHLLVWTGIRIGADDDQ